MHQDMYEPGEDDKYDNYENQRTKPEMENISR